LRKTESIAEKDSA